MCFAAGDDLLDLAGSRYYGGHVLLSGRGRLHFFSDLGYGTGNAFLSAFWREIQTFRLDYMNILNTEKS